MHKKSLFKELDVNKYINLLPKIDNIEKLKIDGVNIFYTKEWVEWEKLNKENFCKWGINYSGDKKWYWKNINKKKYMSFNVEETGATGYMSGLHLYRFLEFYFDSKLGNTT